MKSSDRAFGPRQGVVVLDQFEFNAGLRENTLIESFGKKSPWILEPLGANDFYRRDPGPDDFHSRLILGIAAEFRRQMGFGFSPYPCVRVEKFGRRISRRIAREIRYLVQKARRSNAYILRIWPFASKPAALRGKEGKGGN